MQNSLLFLGDWFSVGQESAHDAVGQHPFVFNLEGPISRNGTPAPGKIPLRMETNRILACFGRAPAAVCLANNHIADYGNQAFEDTLAELHALNIPFFGAGSEADHFHNPAVITVGGWRIALLGYVCPSTNPIFADQDHYGVCAIDPDRIARDVQSAREEGADRVVVCLHWGWEDVLLPTPHDVRTAHQIIDSGADAIIAHHAHSPQPVEIYRHKTIAYGLGNFLMSDTSVPLYSAGDPTTPSAMFRLQLRYWNRASWGVLWNPEDLSSQTRQFFFDDHCVVERPFKRALPSLNGPAWLYRLRFRLHVPIHPLRSVALDYLRNPAHLKPRHALATLHIVLKSRR